MRLAPANSTGQRAATRSILTGMPERYRPTQNASTRLPYPHQRGSVRGRWPSGVGRVLACLLAAALSTTALPAQDGGIDASIHGLILMNAFHTSDDVNNSDVPQFVLPAGEPSRTSSSATVRQSEVTVMALVPGFAGGQLTGVVDVDFFGGQQPS